MILTETEEYKKGYFEIEDDSFQIMFEKIKIEEGSNVLFYDHFTGCKSLNLVHKMKVGFLFKINANLVSFLETIKSEPERSSINSNFMIIHFIFMEL